MKLHVAMIMLLSSVPALAQDSSSIQYKVDTNLLRSYTFKSPYSKDGAKQDITNGQMRILFSGGFGGMPTFSNQKDKAFQKKYNVLFHSQGCIRFGEDEDHNGYNLTIFAYLDLKYGTKWRSEIRSDAIGLMSLKY